MSLSELFFQLVQFTIIAMYIRIYWFSSHSLYNLIYESVPKQLISPLQALAAQITAVSPGFGTLI